MVIFFNRKTGEAFVCESTYAEEAKSILFGEGRRREGDYDRIPVHPATSVRFRAIGEKHLDITTIPTPDNILI